MNEIPKVVFSDSLASADWGETTIAAGDLAAAITRLKQERSDGYLLAHGGVRFARSLVETGLIDEYRLVIHPVVPGAGERIFLAPLTIEPTSTTAFSGGAVAHVFAAHPVRPERRPVHGPRFSRIAIARRGWRPTAGPCP
jgi:dihydrofolate reductase